MINIIRNLLAPKVGVRAVMRGFISSEAAMTLQAIVRSANIEGWMRVVGKNYVLIELEGPRPKIEDLIQQLQHTTFDRSKNNLLDHVSSSSAHRS